MRFYEGDYVAAVLGQPELAANPSPANEATHVLRDVVLSWTPGEFAEQHDVYFGAGLDDVNNATATVDPAGVYLTVAVLISLLLSSGISKVFSG